MVLARQVNGYYSGPFRTTNAPKDTEHLLSVQADSNEPGSPARLKVDNTVLYDSQTKGHGPSMFNDAVITWGAERANLDENNYGHFWGLMKRRHDFSWGYFEDHQQRKDNDPDYKCVRPSQTEGYSQHI